MRKKGILPEEIQTQDLISLIEIYLAEWCHRDELLWKQIFRYFYVTILVIFMPNIADFLQITLPNRMQNIWFPIVGIFLSGIFLYVSLGYVKRLEAISKTYQKLIRYLPNALQRYPITNPEIKCGKYFNCSMSTILSMLMFLGSFGLSVLMILYYVFP